MVKIVNTLFIVFTETKSVKLLINTFLALITTTVSYAEMKNNSNRVTYKKP